MDSWGITHSGKVRKVNQDVYKILIDENRKNAILVVCDGMGGANAGSVASMIAADVFTDFINNALSKAAADAPLDDIADIVTDAADAANKAVFNRGQNDIECSGMGTTLVALISTATGEIVANIGDSRAYHITPCGISQITKDHSVVEDMVDRGEITRSQAAGHPRRNLITRAVGAELYVESDIYMQTIDSGDIVLLCTDGLSNVLSENKMLDILQSSSSLNEACDMFVNEALSCGAPDNVTAAVFRK